MKWLKNNPQGWHLNYTDPDVEWGYDRVTG